MNLKLVQNGSRRRGSYGPSGTEEANSCGAIAIYNILQLCGHKVTYASVRDEISRRWISATVLGGILGTNPLYVLKVLKKALGVRLSLHKADDRKYEDGVYLILYFYLWGAHFVAATIRDGELKMFNETVEAANFAELKKNTGAKLVLTGRVYSLDKLMA